MTRTPLILGLFTAAMLTACASTPDPLPEPEPVVEQPEPVAVKTCIDLADLRRVVVPAETKKVIAITEIANPPYEPIQRREEQTRIVKPEYVYYVDDETGATVTESCEGPIEVVTSSP